MEFRREGVMVDCGLKDIKGNGEPFMKFKVTEPIEEQTEFIWTGWVNKSDEARKIAADALLVAGFAGDDLEDLKAGKDIRFWELDKPVSLVIEKVDQNGKTFFRVKYVNKLVNEFKGQAVKMGGLFAARRAELGITKDKSDTAW